MGAIGTGGCDVTFTLVCRSVSLASIAIGCPVLSTDRFFFCMPTTLNFGREVKPTQDTLFTLFTLLAYLNYTLQTPNRSPEPSDSL